MGVAHVVSVSGVMEAQGASLYASRPNFKFNSLVTSLTDLSSEQVLVYRSFSVFCLLRLPSESGGVTSGPGHHGRLQGRFHRSVRCLW